MRRPHHGFPRRRDGHRIRGERVVKQHNARLISQPRRAARANLASRAALRWSPSRREYPFDLSIFSASAAVCAPPSRKGSWSSISIAGEPGWPALQPNTSPARLCRDVLTTGGTCSRGLADRPQSARHRFPTPDIRSVDSLGLRAAASRPPTAGVQTATPMALLLFWPRRRKKLRRGRCSAAYGPGRSARLPSFLNTHRDKLSLLSPGRDFAPSKHRTALAQRLPHMLRSLATSGGAEPPSNSHRQSRAQALVDGAGRCGMVLGSSKGAPDGRTLRECRSLLVAL